MVRHLRRREATHRLGDVTDGRELVSWAPDDGTRITTCRTVPADPSLIASGDTVGRVRILKLLAGNRPAQGAEPRPEDAPPASRMWGDTKWEPDPIRATYDESDLEVPEFMRRRFR